MAALHSAGSAELLVITTTIVGNRPDDVENLLRSIPTEAAISLVFQGECEVAVPASLVGRRCVVSTIPVSPLSVARNAGVLAARDSLAVTGDTVVAFPDDDALWSHGLGEALLAVFRDRRIGFALGSYGPDMASLDRVRFPETGARVTPRIALDRSASACLFVSWRHVAGRRFREDVGLGAAWPAAEDTAYVLDLLSDGIPGRYEPELFVHHAYGAPEAGRRVAGLFVMATFVWRFPTIWLPLVRGVAHWSLVLRGRDRARVAHAVMAGLSDRVRARR